MLYSEFVNKVMEVTITEADNGLFYLEPLWKQIIIDNELSTEKISDRQIYLDELKDILKLEVEKRNIINSKKPFVIGWLYEIISGAINPAMLQDETELFRQLNEYMKANKDAQALKDKEDWDKFTEI